MAELQMLRAGDAEINKEYLLVISPSSIYKLKIIAKHEGSVTVQDERYTSLGSISLESILTEFDEEFYKESKKLFHSKEEKGVVVKHLKKDNFSKTNKVKEDKMRTKNPKSKVVDKFLAEVPEGQVPDWESITQKVALELNEQGESNLKKLTALARVRYWMFTKGGKINKFRTQS